MLPQENDLYPVVSGRRGVFGHGDSICMTGDTVYTTGFQTTGFEQAAHRISPC
jgi:hypothetical protein